MGVSQMTYYQQGDVKLHPVGPEALVSQADRYFGGVRYKAGTTAALRDDLQVAEGEATGHAHRVDMAAETTAAGARAEVMELFGDRFLIVTGGAVTLTHEEHGPQVIEPGTYRVDIVKEYDPFMRVTRLVAD